MSTHRTNILKLATKISMESLTYTGITFNDPEYRILDPIIDDDMCEVFMHLKLNTNRTLEEVAKRTGCSEEHAKEQLDKLINTGAVRFRERDGVTYYFYPIWVPGIMEGILSNREQCDTYPDLAVCFEEYTRTRIAILAPNASTGMSFMRVIPVEAAVKNNTKVASYDEVSTLIENARAISVGPCSCRRSRRLMGEGCGHLEEDMCIYLNDNAYTYTKSGAHRMISKEEAYEILKRAEDNGLVHELNQSEGFDGTTAICNCCNCACFALRIGTYFNTPDMLRTNYVAEVDPELCTACGACVENCHPNALKLGKKLCSVNPIPGPAPDPLPEDYFWGKAQYNVNYRDRSDALESGTSPCKAANPASLPYQGILKLASQGRNKQAYKMITKYIPFPAVIGRIAEDLPERVCTRASVDEPVAINEVMKAVGDWGLENGNREVPGILNPQGIKFKEKIAVIGAGPAGLSCAYYLTIQGYPVTVFEKEKKIGGKLQFGIPSFDLDKKLVQKELSVLEEMGIEFKTGVTIGKDVTISQLVEEQGYKAVFLGIGASGADKLGVPGQDASGVVELQEFMRGINSTKKPSVADQVVVLGGNQAALDAARAAVRLGAKKVTLATKKLSTDFRIAKKEGVEFVFGMEPAKVETDAKDNAKSIVLKKDNGEEKTLKAGTVIYDGQRAELLPLLRDVKIITGADAYVKVEEMTYQTSVPYIFAGGDVVTGPKYAMDAMVAGREAAISIHRFVQPGQDLKIGRDQFDYKAIDMKNTVLPESDGVPRQKTPEVTKAKAIGTFNDLRGTLSAEQVKKEASRCLGCGVVQLNENMCVGCGICTTKCNFGAITLKKVRDDKGGPYFNTLGRVGINAVKRYSSVAVKKVARPFGKKSDS